MENLNFKLCGCSQQKLEGRSTEENLQECRVCGIQTTCPYPHEALLKMAKEAEEQDATEEQDVNLQDLARQSHDFADFHQKTTHKQDKLDREPDRILEQTQQQDRLHKPQKKNLQDIARRSMTFSDYHEQAQDV